MCAASCACARAPLAPCVYGVPVRVAINHIVYDCSLPVRQQIFMALIALGTGNFLLAPPISSRLKHTHTHTHTETSRDENNETIIRMIVARMQAKQRAITNKQDRIMV